MKRIAIALVVCGAMSLPADAQSCNRLSSFQHWNLNTMTADEQARINFGLRNGSLTRKEAARLQSQLDRVRVLKRKLSANGLTLSERQRLDRQLDNLGEKIFRESRDNQRGRWLGTRPFSWTNALLPGRSPFFNGNYNVNTAGIQARINAGRRSGKLTSREAAKLNKQLNDVNRLRAKLSRGGLTLAERTRLDRKIDRLNDKITREMRDNQVSSRSFVGWRPSGNLFGWWR